MKMSTRGIPEITVTRFLRMLPTIELNPPYQREGGVWTLQVKQVLIDSMINGFDLPKFYFEVARGEQAKGLRYFVLDGKQRLETIQEFCNGDISLADDFIYFEDEQVKAGGMGLEDLRTRYPLLAERFYYFELPIVEVASDSGDLVEELFQRLNAASALNSAERRNAISGPTKNSVNRLAEHEFLLRRSPIKNARYKYRELASKFIAIEHQSKTRGKVIDTKAATLMALFKDGKSGNIAESEIDSYEESAIIVLENMSSVFEDNDRLLASIGTVVVYYILFRNSLGGDYIKRDALANFEEYRQKVNKMQEDDQEYDSPLALRIREYNSLVQSTNDGSALARRSVILNSYLLGVVAGDVNKFMSELSDAELGLAEVDTEAEE